MGFAFVARSSLRLIQCKATHPLTYFKHLLLLTAQFSFFSLLIFAHWLLSQMFVSRWGEYSQAFLIISYLIHAQARTLKEACVSWHVLAQPYPYCELSTPHMWGRFRGIPIACWEEIHFWFLDLHMWLLKLFPVQFLRISRVRASGLCLYLWMWGCVREIWRFFMIYCASSLAGWHFAFDFLVETVRIVVGEGSWFSIFLSRSLHLY